jgi:signal transduction histidine kinase
LQREDSKRHDPIVVEFENDEKKLLDFYELLLAQTHVHLLKSISLNEANEFKKELLGILAHDLRSPINSIIGFSQELKEANFINDESTTYLNYIEIAAKQMNDLMNDLLASALNDATEYELNCTDFELISLIDSIVFSFKKYYESKKQVVQFNPSHSQIIIKADRQKIKEVFENLISNAIKYSEYGKKIVIEAKYEDKYAEISIQDEGQGFTEDDLSKLYLKFQRLSAKPTSYESSTGLGLYIVKKIIDYHDGKIILDTAVNKGSTFKVLLPISETRELNESRNFEISEKN